MHISGQLDVRCRELSEQGPSCVKQSTRLGRQASPSLHIASEKIRDDCLCKIAEHTRCRGCKCINADEDVVEFGHRFRGSLRQNLELHWVGCVPCPAGEFFSGLKFCNDSHHLVGIGKRDVTDLQLELFQRLLGELLMHVRKEPNLIGMEWKRGLCTATIGKPAESFLLFLETSRNLRGSPLVASRQGVGVGLRFSALAKAPLDDGELPLDSLEALFHVRDGPAGPLSTTPFVLPAQNAPNAFLKEPLVLARGAESRDTEVADVIWEQPAQNREGLRSVGRHEDAITGRQEMTDQICDRVALSGSRRAFDKYIGLDLQSVGDLALLIVGGQREEETGRCQSCRVIAIWSEPTRIGGTTR